MDESISYDLTPALYRKMLVAESVSKRRKLYPILLLFLVGIAAVSILGYYRTGTLEIFELWVPVLISRITPRIPV